MSPAAQAIAPTVTISAVSGDGLAGPLREGQLGDFRAKSGFAACLLPLLSALGWRRDLREIAESLPHFADTLDLTDLCNVVARLGYNIQKISGTVATLDARLLPCLLVDGDTPSVLLSRLDGNQIRLFDGTGQVERIVDAGSLSGNIHLVTPQTSKRIDERFKKDNWLGEIARRFRGVILQLAGLTLFLNLLALMVPLYVMTVYDQVIPTQSKSVLAYLGSGIAIVLLAEGVVRLLRSRIISYLGGRVEYIVATAALGRLFSLPVSLTETVPIGRQVARLKEFDVVRELFAGPLVSVVLEMPFLVIFLAVIAALAGPLALIPVVMLGLFMLVTVILVPKMRRHVATSGTARAERHGFLVETVTNIRTIHETNAGARWLERYRNISAEACYTHFKASQITFLFQTLSQALMMTAGVATVAFGVRRVIDGDMTVGALIATMALVWRVLAPMHSLFLTLARLEQIRISLKQINQLMRMPVEGGETRQRMTRREFKGAVDFSRVSFRYSADTEPALLGLGFRLKSGEMLAITGPSGSGKSTILRLILGLYAPQAGQVSVGGLDIRQIDPYELRHSIAYVPQTINLFHGTIAQNLRLSNPAATDDDLDEACDMAGMTDEIAALKAGLATRLGDQNIHHLNSGFRQRLALARAYVRKAPILLLDEADQRLDNDGDATFIETLKRIRGSSTIILVSHRPSHMRLADKMILMKKGRAVMGGRPDDILAKMFEATA